jgi:methionyl aminopeptidase
MVYPQNLTPEALSDHDPVTGAYNPFPEFSFPGIIRPVYPLSAMRTVPKSIKHPDWAETGIPKGERRLSSTKIDILDAKGQEAMRKACRLAREVLDITAAEIKPGITTDYLDEVCHRACVERNVSATLFQKTLIVSYLTVISFSFELQWLSQISVHFSE